MALSVEVLCRKIPLEKGPTKRLGLPEPAGRRVLPEPRFSDLPRLPGGELRRTGHTKKGGACTEAAEAEGSPSAEESVSGTGIAAGEAEGLPSAASATCLAL